MTSAPFKRFFSSSLFDMAVRLLTIPVTGVSSLAVAAILIHDGGAQYYASVSLIWSVAQLLPLSDLGLGAVVTNAVAGAKGQTGDVEIRATVERCFRILVFAATIILMVAALTSFFQVWSRILPVDKSTMNVDGVVLVTLAIMAVSMPLSLWQRIALGLHMNRYIIVLTSLTTPIVLLMVWLAIGRNSFLVVGAPAVAGLVVIVGGVMVLQIRRGFPVLSMMRLRPSCRVYKGLPLWRSGAAMLIIMVSQPIVLQSDRLFIGWFSSPSSVAEYSLQSQLYVPLLSIVSAGAASLWPRFVAARSGLGQDWALFRSSVLRFSVIGLVFGIALVSIGPFILAFVSRGAVDISIPIAGAFALLLLVQAATMTPAMFLTSENGLRFQAKALIAMLIIKLPLSAFLAHYGAIGPVLASILAIFLCQFVPSMFYCRILARTGSQA